MKTDVGMIRKKARLRTIAIAGFLCIPVCVHAQFPGGVSGNLKLWLKGNSGITTNTGGKVTQWNERSGAGITGDFVTQPAANVGMNATQNPPAYVSAGINFNPHVSFFTADVNSIASNNAFVGTQLIDPYSNTLLQVIKLRNMTGTGVWLKWQYNNSNANRLGNEVNNGGANSGKMRFDFRGVNNFSNTVIADQYVLANCNTTQAQSVIRLNGATDNTVNYGTQAAFTAPATSPARFTLGNEAYGDAYPTTIDIAEVILYNKALTAIERNKVESYLAVKYGFTLDQSAANATNYTASDGTVIWNRNASQPFLNNITGIGRDDADSLAQKQSRSINTAGLITLANGTYTGASLPLLNSSNSSSFSTDKSYLLIGDNGAGLALNRCVSANPSFLRMSRAWKAQVTGNMATVTILAGVNTLPANTRHLLISSDSAFTGSTTTSYRLDTANGMFSKSVVLQDGQFFTFASDSLLLKPASNSPLCAGSTIQLSANVAATGTFLWTGPGGFSSTAQSPSIANALLANSGVYTVNASVNGCAFAPGSITVTVATQPPPPVVIPVFYCTGDIPVPLTAAGTGLAWYTIPAGGALPGSTVPPVPSTTSPGVYDWWVVQSNDGCESIRAKQVVTVRDRPNGVITSPKAVICQGDIDSFFYYGNATATMQYDWKASNGLTTHLGGSGQGPLIYRFDSAGTINVRMQVNNDGCVSKEAIFPVKVNPRPIAYALLKTDACVGEIVDIILTGATQGISTMKWDFDGGSKAYATETAGPYGVVWPSAGLKYVTHTSFSAGCPSFTITDTAAVHAAPDVRIAQAANGEICAGDSVLFTAATVDTVASYTWTPAPFFKYGGGNKALGFVNRSGYVHVNAVSQWGCIASDSVLVKTKPCCGVYLPNAFTPNNDGTNDVFRIVTAGHHAVSGFRVVNRWGQVMFETANESLGWDGTYKGVAQDAGVYHYYVRFKCEDGSGYDVEQKGEVTLIR